MTMLANRYELGRLLGSGGMARVHEATDRVLGRRVAVKLLRPGTAPDPSTRARLLAEARAAAKLAHPNAVAVYDAGEEDGEPFIVMEYVDGPTLADELTQRGALPVDEALRHAAGVLAALAAAHRRGLVHRDVKPGNVLLAGTGEAKLADFGIAKGLDEAAASLTATGQVLGTPHYLAPERAAGASATPRSDVYSVGVLLYEMLTGAPPFDGDRPLSVALAHQSTPVPRIDERSPAVPEWVAAVVHRALSKHPAQRFATAEEMLAALAGTAGAALAGPGGRGGGTLDTAPLLVPGPDAVDGWAGAPGGEPVAAVPQAASAGEADGDGRRVRVVPMAAVSAVALLALAAVLGATVTGGTPAGEARTAGDGPEVVAATQPEPSDVEPPEPTDPTEPPSSPEPSEPEPDDAEAEPGEAEPAGLEPVSERLAPAEALAAFAAALAGDPDAAGEKGEDLVEDVWEVLGERGDERRSETRELMSDVEEWVEKGELDGNVGGEALRLLAEVAGEGEGDSEGESDGDESEVSGSTGGGGNGKAGDGRGPDGRGPPGQRGRGRGRGR